MHTMYELFLLDSLFVWSPDPARVVCRFKYWNFSNISSKKCCCLARSLGVVSTQNASSLCDCASLLLYMVTKNDFDSLLALRGYHVILVQCATGI